jgi:hypothetical protein
MTISGIPDWATRIILKKNGELKPQDSISQDVIGKI